jgi:hypothetical protein
MKKVLTAVVALAFVAMSASSCNKCYTCSCAGVTTPEYCSKTYSSTQLDALKASCQSGGCTWSSK